MARHPLKLLVRADVGPTVGTGHVMRTLALGQAWQQMGGTVTFACGQLPSGLIKRIESEQFRFIQTPHDQCDASDAQFLAEIATSENPSWIVLDGYRFDDRYQEHLQPAEPKLLVIDDYGHATHEHADLVLNQNVYAQPDLYPNSDYSKLLAGSDYVLLRTEFTRSHVPAVEPKRTVKEARRILVTFGGADPDNWTLKTLQTLSDLNRKRLIVDCVIGACYQHGAELEIFKKTANMNLRIHRNVDRMAALMTRVDMAITAGGSTCYELAHCGVPAIVMPIADNQKPIAASLHHENVMLSIDHSEADLRPGQQDDRLKTAIRQLINDSGRRQTMSENGTRLVDGQGSHRIAEALVHACYPLRNAQVTDADTLWHWRNDPEVRSVSLTRPPGSFETHLESLQHQMDDPHTELWISEDSAGDRVGQISFEITRDFQTAYIDIIVDESQRGRGVGSILINNACRQIFAGSNVHEIVAQIKPGNAASERAFRTAGFRPIEPVIVDGKMAFQFLRTRENNTVTAFTPYRKSA